MTSAPFWMMSLSNKNLKILEIQCYGSYSTRTAQRQGSAFAFLIRGKTKQLLALNNPNELSCTNAHVLILPSENTDSNANSIPFPIKNKCAVQHT